MFDLFVSPCWLVFSTGPRFKCSFTVSFLGEGSPTKIEYRKMGTLILTFVLEDLGSFGTLDKHACQKRFHLFLALRAVVAMALASSDSDLKRENKDSDTNLNHHKTWNSGIGVLKWTPTK